MSFIEDEASFMYSSLLDSISLYSQTPTGITPPTLTVIASSSRTLNLNSRVIEPLGIQTHLLVRIFFWLWIAKYSKHSATFNSDILCQCGDWPWMTSFNSQNWDSKNLWAYVDFLNKCLNLNMDHKLWSITFQNIIWSIWHVAISLKFIQNDIIGVRSMFVIFLYYISYVI